MGETFVGVDVGTTFIKAVVYNADLSAVGEDKVRTPWRQTQSGGDADPDAIVAAVVQALEGALARAGTVRVDALGVTGMGETGVLVDGHGHPVAPAIAWHDRRGLAQAHALARAVDGFAESSGRAPSPLPSVVKWRVLSDDGLDLGRVRRWYNMAEWVVHRLGGQPQTEASLVSRTGALDVRRGELNPDAVHWAGGRLDWFGQVVPAGTPAGLATVGPPAILGSMTTVAGLDGYASALGVGADTADVAFLSCGTSGAAVRTVPGVLTDVSIALTLAGRAGCTVLTLGGEVRGPTLATVGPWAEGRLRSIHTDVAFVATNGLSLARGLTTPNPIEAEVKRLIIQTARRVVLVADHTKINHDFFEAFGTIADIDLLITDAGIDVATVQEFEAAGVTMVSV